MSCALMKVVRAELTRCWCKEGGAGISSRTAGLKWVIRAAMTRWLGV
jgi:hypothetical protein